MDVFQIIGTGALVLPKHDVVMRTHDNLALSTQKSCISFLDMSFESSQVTKEHLIQKFTIQGHGDISKAFML